MGEVAMWDIAYDPNATGSILKWPVGMSQQAKDDFIGAFNAVQGGTVVAFNSATPPPSTPAASATRPAESPAD